MRLLPCLSLYSSGPICTRNEGASGNVACMYHQQHSVRETQIVSRGTLWPKLWEFREWPMNILFVALGVIGENRSLLRKLDRRRCQGWKEVVSENRVVHLLLCLFLRLKNILMGNQIGYHCSQAWSRFVENGFIYTRYKTKPFIKRKKKRGLTKANTEGFYYCFYENSSIVSMPNGIFLSQTNCLVSRCQVSETEGSPTFTLPFRNRDKVRNVVILLAMHRHLAFGKFIGHTFCGHESLTCNTGPLYICLNSDSAPNSVFFAVKQFFVPEKRGIQV